MIGRNALLALLLSLPLTLALGFLYALSPLILAMLSFLWKGITSSAGETGGIGAVAGGVSVSFSKMLALVAAILFLIIFAVLQKRSMQR